MKIHTNGTVNFEEKILPKGGRLYRRTAVDIYFQGFVRVLYLDCSFARLVTMGGPIRGQVEMCAHGVGQNGPACRPKSHEVSGWGFVTVT